MGSREKPAFGPVTTVPCRCKYLERASDDPENPIFFDADVNEYNYRGIGKSRSTWGIRHCPWCGGAAPKSKRASLFATVTREEEQRLRDITRGLKSVEDVIEKFGKPDHEMAEGLVTKSAESDTEPSKIRSYRVLHYFRLSETADVHFTDYEGGVRATFQGKYLGKPKKGPSRGVRSTRTTRGHSA